VHTNRCGRRFFTSWIDVVSSAEHAAERLMRPEWRRREAWSAKREVMNGRAWEAREGSGRCDVREYSPSRRSAQSSRAVSAVTWSERNTRRVAERPEEWSESLEGAEDGRLAMRASTSVAVGAEKSGPGRRRITIHKELQRRRLHRAVAFGLVLRLGLVVVALIVVVEVVVLAVVDWQRQTPVRRVVVLESAHGRWWRCSGDSGDGVGVDFVGLRRFFPFFAMGTGTPGSREGRTHFFILLLFPRLRRCVRSGGTPVDQG
jgi:hypothetical protein